MFSQIICEPLRERNGFRDIKLGSSPNEYSFLIKQEVNELSVLESFKGNKWDCIGTTTGPSSVRHMVDLKKSGYTSLGPDKIEDISTHTFEDKIYKIVIKFVNQCDNDVRNSLITVFGKTAIFAPEYTRQDKYNERIITISLQASDGKEKDMWSGNIIPCYSFLTYSDQKISSDYCHYMSNLRREEKRKEAEKLKDQF